ncbi:MAG: hypothetical protein MUE37_12380 [Bacteroidales bacterium]|nr:hypothetical protein [Bacteroidales bacterium]
MKKMILFCLAFGFAFMSAGQDMYTPRQLTFDPAQNGFATWAPDGRSIVFQHTDMRDTLGKNGLWQISPDGKDLRQVFSGVAEHPRWSPDERYLVFDADTGNSIRMIPARGGEIIRVLPDSVVIQNGGLPCWSPDGSRVAFVERKWGSLCTYNLRTHELKSLFREDGKIPLPGGWWSDGKSILVALMDLQTRKSTIERISADGKVRTQIPCQQENFYRYLALSPDGSLLVFGAVKGRYIGLYIMSSDGGPALPLAVTENNHNEGAAWSPDGKHIAFTSTRSGNFDIWIMDVDIDEIKAKLQAQPPRGCSVITFSKGDSIFFAGNDDYTNADSYFWVEPGDSSKYGVIWIGWPDDPQQGVNEKGLAYDGNGLPRVEVNPHTERIPYAGQEYHQYLMQIMHECSTVEEVIRWAGIHQRPPYMHDQMHFADATGEAVIISAGADGEVVFSHKGRGDAYLVSTNFNVANPSYGYSHPCWRYNMAGEMLGELLAGDSPVTARDITAVMDAVHVSSGSSWTIETMVADLVNGIIYIYFFYQYDHPVIINVRQELASPREPGPLSQLFPQDVRDEAARRYRKARMNMVVSKVAGISWPAIVMLSLILLFVACKEPAKGLGFWLPAVIVLGPVALVIRYFVKRKCRSGLCSEALTGTLGNSVPLVISYTAGLSILVARSVSGGASQGLQLILMLVVPLILGWVYHLFFLAHLTNRKGMFILHRLPQVLITTFLGLGGMIPVAMPLVNNTLNMSLIIPLSPLAITGWWAMVVAGALAGGLLIFLFGLWEARGGFRSWTVIAQGEGDLVLPPFRRLWWWIPVSLVILIAGLASGVVLLK